MTALAVANIVFGGMGVLSGVLRMLRSLVLIYELWRLDVLGFSAASPGSALLALLVLATGIVGIITGIGIFALRPWARALSLVYGGLFIFSSVVSFAAAIVNSPVAYDATNLILAISIYLVIPALYALILYLAFQRPAWKAAFAESAAA